MKAEMGLIERWRAWKTRHPRWHRLLVLEMAGALLLLVGLLWMRGAQLWGSWAANKENYDTHEQLRSHLADFVTAYNFARRLKALKGLSPYEHICKAWTKEPQRFNLNPLHQMPGLNNTGHYPRNSSPQNPI